ncbi:MAG: hypothetical protein ACI3U0_07110, partial [Oscillospiraceae bacterium]
NVQEQPALGRAHRTSPTNIGLALLSVLAAADLGFVRREEAAALAEDMALSLTAPEYGAEPFVLSADIAYAPGKEGRAGWSWYTGAAGWYLRLLRELYGETP